ncbi:hypothetical protein IE53DRAFT_335141 [Violaceomyces palustris]|uniref:Uncharacterized protein n=1 Tax=Violaceomyces palustris TaxID=1673888 RepID=A0ACD0NPB2_9BASI|nr:hypothetical protein IE53DRAFT_335141 [Violaceomyces palustris]
MVTFKSLGKSSETKDLESSIVKPLCADPPVETKQFRIIGSGTSAQVPHMSCLLTGFTRRDGLPCTTCEEAWRNSGSKNRRFNTSAAIDRDLAGVYKKMIMFDCGKSFREAVANNIARYGGREIEGVVLTHLHEDAVAGLGELREYRSIQDAVDIYLTETTFKAVTKARPYFDSRSVEYENGPKEGQKNDQGETAEPKTFVSRIRWHIIDENYPFRVGETWLTPLPVHHGFNGGGEPFICLGFKVDGRSYISDCHHIPLETTKLIDGSHTIVLDALSWKKHFSHFSIHQALSYAYSFSTRDGVQTLPQRVILTDLTHDFEHHATNQELRAHGDALRAWAYNKFVVQGDHLTGDEGVGEAGGLRWWDGAWKDDISSDGTPGLKLTGEAADFKIPSMPSSPPLGPFKVKESKTGRELTIHVPEVLLAYDDMIF